MGFAFEEVGGANMHNVMVKEWQSLLGRWGAGSSRRVGNSGKSHRAKVAAGIPLSSFLFRKKSSGPNWILKRMWNRKLMILKRVVGSKVLVYSGRSQN